MSVGLSFYIDLQAYSTRLAMEPMPSGSPVELFEVLIDDVAGEAWLRFRFLAPALANDMGASSFQQVQEDLEHLCGMVALPYMSQFDLQADVVVITLMDRAVPFGATDTEATQVIEAFRVSPDGCVWEVL